MANTKVVAVFIVAIIVVAGVGIFAFGGLNKNTSDAIDGELLIYGNANGDSSLDDSDVKLLEQIIAGDVAETDFADANQDGKINEDDITLVKKLIAGESATAYYYDALNEVSESFDYPLKSVYPIGVDCLLATKILGAESMLVAVDSSTRDSVLFADVYAMDIPNYGSKPTLEQVSEIADELGAIITLTSSRSVTNEATLEATGAIKVIRLGFDQADNISAYLTYGFMINKTDRAESFSQFTESVLSEISSKVSVSISDSDRMKGLVLGYNVIYGTQQNYGTIITNAGGINVVDWDAYRLCSDGYEWLYEYDFDYIVGLANSAGYDYKTVDTAVSDCITIWDKHYNRYAETQAVKDGHLFVMDNNMPIIIKTAYVAEQFYPEVFGDGYGDSIHQKYVDAFIDNLSGNFDVSEDGVFVLTFEFIAELKASQE